MSFTATLRPCRPYAHTSMLRLTLFPGETYQVPRPFGRVGIWTGTAWISHAGQDRRLTAGEEMRFDLRRDRPIISPLGASTLTFEIREEQSCR
jgi:hypothetical protein